MAATKKTDLSGLDASGLKAKAVELRKGVFDLRIKHATAQLENTASIKAAKRELARVLTALKEKESRA